MPSFTSLSFSQDRVKIEKHKQIKASSRVIDSLIIIADYELYVMFIY